jgi:hypothetical protein
VAQKPFASLDLTDTYIVHDVTLFAHNHPTEPDSINAGVKALETALKAFDLDDYDLGGGGGGDTVGGYVNISTSRSILPDELQGHLLVCTNGAEIDLPSTATLPDNARCDIVAGDASLIKVFTHYAGKSDNDILLYLGGTTTNGFQSSTNIGSFVSLRKYGQGWIALAASGFGVIGGGGK